METALEQQKPKVYIVDDDASVRRALERLLRSAGYFALTFSSAEEFLLFSGIASEGFLILDIHLPGMSGLDLQERLSLLGREYPVIFMTAHDNPAWQERARKARALAYLRKPFPEQALLDAIRVAFHEGV